MELKSDNGQYRYNIADPLADIILRTPTFTLYRATCVINQEERLLLIANDPHQNDAVTNFSDGIRRLCARYGWSDREMPVHCDGDNTALDEACHCGVSFPCFINKFVTSRAQGNRMAFSCQVCAPLNNLFPLVSLYNYCTISSATAMHLFYDYLLIIDQLQRAGMGHMLPVCMKLFFVDTHSCHLLYLGCGNEYVEDSGGNNHRDNGGQDDEYSALNIASDIINGAAWFYDWSNFDGDFADANDDACDCLGELSQQDWQDPGLTLSWAINAVKNIIEEHFSWDFTDRKFDYRPHGENGLYKAPELTLAHYYGLDEQK